LAAVYSREIDGKTLTLAPSGWTYGSDRGSSLFVLYDKETESLWYPFDSTGLTGITGAYKDRKLTELTQLTRTPWSDWKDSHPATGYLLP